MSADINAKEFLKGQYLTQSEVAEILQVSTDTVRRRCDSGQLRRVYHGRSPRICAHSVGQYLFVNGHNRTQQ